MEIILKIKTFLSGGSTSSYSKLPQPHDSLHRLTLETKEAWLFSNILDVFCM